MKTFLLPIFCCVSALGTEPCKKSGDICKLKPTGIKLASTEWTPTASDVPAYEELKKALKANDTDGLQQMVLAGKLFFTASGDSVRVLEVSGSSGYSEIRITSGEYKGTKAVTVSAWVVP